MGTPLPLGRGTPVEPQLRLVTQLFLGAGDAAADTSRTSRRGEDSMHSGSGTGAPTLPPLLPVLARVSQASIDCEY